MNHIGRVLSKSGESGLCRNEDKQEKKKKPTLLLIGFLSRCQPRKNQRVLPHKQDLPLRTLLLSIQLHYELCKFPCTIGFRR